MGLCKTCKGRIELIVVKLVNSWIYQVGNLSAAGSGTGASASSQIQEEGGCAACGHSGSKKCSGCKRVRYCSEQCQTKHWRDAHKFKCKQMRLQPQQQPSRRITNEIIFLYDEFLKLFNWDYDEFSPCGLENCGNSCFANAVLQCLTTDRLLLTY